MQPVPQRLAKVIARSGLCSRREAESWIINGRVTVNNLCVYTPSTTVTHTMRILVDGQDLPSLSPPRIWRYYKPKQILVTRAHVQDKNNVFEYMAQTLPQWPQLPRLISVGRLDFTSEGLLLFSNDGDVTRFLELPSTGWKRRYRVRVHGKVTPQHIEDLANGITHDGISYRPIQAKIDHQAATNTWLSLTLKEGKNREIRRVMASLSLPVSRLIRISYGPFLLGDMKKGQLEEIPRNALKSSLSQELTRKFF